MFRIITSFKICTGLRSRPRATTVEELRRPNPVKDKLTPSWSCRGGEMMSSACRMPGRRSTFRYKTCIEVWMVDDVKDIHGDNPRLLTDANRAR